MVAYSFQPQFVDPISSGRKRQTIRAHGLRRHAKAGDALQIYTGMRTKACRLRGRAVCESISDIQIQFFASGENRADVVKVDGKRVQDRDAFAQADGFLGWLEMRSFWLKAHGVGMFDGRLIRWKDFVPA